MSPTPQSFACNLDTLNSLPSLNPVVLRLSAIASNPASCADDVVDALKLDPALTGKALRLANSAYVGLPHSIASLKNAVVLLGLKRIFSLVLTTSVLSCFVKKITLPFEMDRYWRHSVCVAMAGESMAKILRRYNPVDSDDVFIGGLLHDIGKLALGNLAPSVVSAAINDGLTAGIPFFKAETPERSHAVIGGRLARRWNFPKHLTASIEFHHTPILPDDSDHMPLIIHVADALVHMTGMSTYPGEAAPDLHSEALSRLHIQPERLRAIANEAVCNEKAVEACMECFQ